MTPSRRCLLACYRSAEEGEAAVLDVAPLPPGRAAAVALSQNEEIRMLLQRASGAPLTGAVPPSLSELMGRVDAGKTNPFHQLAGSVAMMARARENTELRRQMHSEAGPGLPDAAERSTAYQHDEVDTEMKSPPPALFANMLHQQAAEHGDGEREDRSSFLSASVSVAAIVRQLETGVGRVEALERSMQTQVGELARLVSLVSALQGRLEDGLGRLDAALLRLGVGLRIRASFV